MVNAQTWLDQNYPRGRKSEVFELDISNKNLEGVLKIENFINLKSLICRENNLNGLEINGCYNLTGLDCSGNELSILNINNFDKLETILCQENKLTKLDFSNCINLEKLNCSYNQIDDMKLDNCSELEILGCGSNQLISLDVSNHSELVSLLCFRNKLTSLNVRNCTKLVQLYCDNNNLANIEINNCPQLKEFDFYGNEIDNFSFLNALNQEKLIILGLADNNFEETDLSLISRFKNLEKLQIGNLDKRRIRSGKYNRFIGSLVFLKDLTKLKTLYIDNTNIDSGLEYLPNSLEKILYEKPHLESAKVNELLSKLNPYREKNKEGNYYNVKKWKEFDKKMENDQLLYEKFEKATKNDQISFFNNLKPNLKFLIGKGGYGEVYYGKWKLQDVAVKKLYPSLNNISQKDLKDIEKEIDILKNLRNRYIIQYYGIYSDEKELLIIMDYAESGTLTKFINNNKDKEHDWNFSNEFIKQIALGLVYIHHEDIIHRDLKSMNILLANNYQVKISDFGLSKTKNISSSQSKDIKGTLKWMAPELLKGQKYSEQSDIYALGMIIWEIVAKCTIPFKDIDDNMVYLHIINNEKEIIPNGIPENIRNIIEQCWKDNPNERIKLEDILEIIKNDKSMPQISYANQVENLSKSQNIKKVNEKLQSYQKTNAPQQVEFPMTELQEALEEDNNSWTALHPTFTPSLISSWQEKNFTPQQVKEWLDIGLQPSDFNFASWLRETKNLTPEQVLDNGDYQQLSQEFFTEWQTQQVQSNIELSPK